MLLIGRNGQVGWELQRSLAPLGELVGLDRDDTTAVKVDLSDLNSLWRIVREIGPDVIVNAAAYTAVDKAEGEPERARLINASAPAILAKLAAESGAWLVHYSTDYVFCGDGSAPWVEDAATGPMNVYGRTKLEGEELIRATGCRHLILRTSWVYASRGQNFARTMLRLASERDSLGIVDDQHGAPTGAELLADVTAHALPVALRQPTLAGTYHVAASGETTWFDYARFLIDTARAVGMTIRVEADAIHGVPSSLYPTAARRPSNSRLATGKFQQAFGLVLPDWRAGVQRVVAELSGR